MVRFDDVPLTKKVITTTIYMILLLVPATAYETGLTKETVRWYDDYISYTQEMPREVVRELQLLEVEIYGNGTCVPYARERTGIQIFGWAGSFLERAKDTGHETSTEPLIGSMVVTSEGGGHVAVVEGLINGDILVSEQNYYGLYVISERLISLDDPYILGYIY